MNLHQNFCPKTKNGGDDNTQKSVFVASYFFYFQKETRGV